MKKQWWIWLMALCITASLWPGRAPTAYAAGASVWDGTTAAEFAGGKGTKDKPYLIETAQQLAYFAQTVNGGADYSGQYVSLQADLDLSRLPWTPIGNGSNAPFRGTFLGNAHTITNLYINQPSTNVRGLFSYCDNGAIVQNLRLTNVSITGNTNVGGITGYLSGGTIQDCNVSGAISGTSNVGGISGYVSFTYSKGFVYQCINNASVLANQGYAGGIVGNNNSEYVNISRCVNNGPVDSYGSCVGGISGRDCTIDNCMNIGAVGGNATNHVGGIYGYYYNYRPATNCANMGTVTSQGSAYGVAFSASNCYNVGMVSGQNGSAYSVSYHKTNCYALRAVAEELDETESNGLTILDAMNTPAFAATLNHNINTQQYSTWLQDPNVYGGLPYFEPRIVFLISVTTPPTKTAYAPGETFDASGMVVTAQCIDGSSYELSLNALTFFPSTPLTEGTSSVTVFYETYETLTTTCAVTVSAKAAPEYEIESVTIRNSNGAALSAIPKGEFMATVAVKRAIPGSDTFVVLSTYTSAGKFNGMLYVQVEEPVGAVTYLTIPVDNASGDIASVRAFAVASFDDLRPLSAPVSFPAA